MNKKGNRFYSLGDHDALDAQSFKNLVLEAQQGSEGAFARVYALCIAPIYRFVYLRVKRKEEAEELTQTIFMKAWSALRTFEEQGKPFLSWLYTIARNTVIDHWKKKKEIHIEAQEEYFANIEDIAPTPAETIARKENAQRIRVAIQRLSEDQQEIVILKYIEDLSNKEISAITGKSEDAIRQTQFRAFKILKSYFKNQDL